MVDLARLPDPLAYFENEGLTLIGRGQWRSTLCPIHDDSSPSLRVNVNTGAFCCMACGVKGGSIVGFQMQRYDQTFPEAAKVLGIWDEARKPKVAGMRRHTSLSGRACVELLRSEMLVALVVLRGVRDKQEVSPEDWERFLRAASRIEFVYEVCA